MTHALELATDSLPQLTMGAHTNTTPYPNTTQERACPGENAIELVGDRGVEAGVWYRDSAPLLLTGEAG